MSKKIKYAKVYLPESEMPKYWYNVMADMPNPIKPYISPATGKPVVPDELSAIFPPELIKQELTTEREIEIPQPVRDVYRQYRPSPLVRAIGLEKALDTPAKIYYKYEGNNPSGSHKLNTALAQAFYNKEAGIKRLTTETGAGQWGTALSVAGAIFGLDVEVYMVKVSYQQKPYRKILMNTYGANVYASPSDRTEAGRAMLAEDPNGLGSLGGAISEAIEVAAQNDDTNYALGSVLNHVGLHQSIIGLEAIKQFEMMDDYPDYVIACNGGGSNFAGSAFPFVGKKLKENLNTEFIAVEPSACPKLTMGKFTYDYADVAGMTPILPMYTLGHKFTPAGIHAGGLRFHGDSPILSQLYHDGIIGAVAYPHSKVFDAAVLFAKTEIIVPAPESSHAIACAIDKALECKKTGEEKTIFFNLSGHGNLDLAAYESYLNGDMEDYQYSEDDLAKGLETVPKL